MVIGLHGRLIAHRYMPIEYEVYGTLNRSCSHGLDKSAVSEEWEMPV